MEPFQENDKISVIYDKNTSFEARIPGYFISINEGKPRRVYFYTSLMQTDANHTYILLQKSNSIIKGWETANPSRVKRELFIEKQLQKLN